MISEISRGDKTFMAAPPSVKGCRFTRMSDADIIHSSHLSIILATDEGFKRNRTTKNRVLRHDPNKGVDTPLQSAVSKSRGNSTASNQRGLDPARSALSDHRHHSIRVSPRHQR